MSFFRKILMCLAVIALVGVLCNIFAQLIPPSSELDRLVYQSRSWMRWWYVAQLARVGLVLAIVLFMWRPVVAFVVKKSGVNKAVAENGRWRVFVWYAAFEAVFLLSFI